MIKKSKGNAWLCLIDTVEKKKNEKYASWNSNWKNFVDEFGYNNIYLKKSSQGGFYLQGIVKLK